MTTIAYTRVSGEAQLDGYGLDIQHDAVHALAATEELPAPIMFTDGGLSGAKDTDERPGLDALILYCEEHPGCTVLLPKLDRLARSLAIQEHLLQRMWNTGATIRSGDQSEDHYLRTGDDPDDPTRTLIRQVIGAVAQFDRGQIRLRLRAGRRREIARAGWAGGVVPYGWADTNEQRILADARALRDDGLTWRAVAGTLNQRGDRKRNGTNWTDTELCRAIRRANARPGQPVLTV